MKYDVIIIGAGIMGAATAYHLSKSHKKILVLEQFGVENDFNTSYDVSRILKFAHGNDELKTKMAIKSLAIIKELEKLSGRKLFYQCGALLIGNKTYIDKRDYGLKSKNRLSRNIRNKYAGDNPNDHLFESYKTLKKMGLKCKFLEERNIQKLYPQFKNNFGLLDLGAGIIEASSVVKLLVKLSKNNGVKFVENSKVVKIDKGYIKLENGQIISCKKIVVATGAFGRKLLGKKVPILPIKKQIIYLKPKRALKFSKKKFPIFLDVNSGFYGLPIHGIDGIKFGNHYIGEKVDPYTVARKVSSDFIQKSRTYLAKMIPDLQDAEIVKSKVCLYEMTPDEEFIIDKIDEDTFFVVGAGHGFKFGPLIGKILSELVLYGKTKHDISRFSLTRFKGEHNER